MGHERKQVREAYEDTKEALSIFCRQNACICPNNEYARRALKIKQNKQKAYQSQCLTVSV